MPPAVAGGLRAAQSAGRGKQLAGCLRLRLRGVGRAAGPVAVGARWGGGRGSGRAGLIGKLGRVFGQLGAAGPLPSLALAAQSAELGLPLVGVAVDETVILLHPPLHLLGASIVMERERQQKHSLVHG